MKGSFTLDSGAVEDRRQLTREGVQKNRNTLFLGIFVACLFCAATFFLVVCASEHMKELDANDSALMDAKSDNAVSTRPHEVPIEDTFTDKGPFDVRWLNVFDEETHIREKVLGFQRFPAGSLVVDQVPVSDDGYHYFFTTPSGTYAASEGFGAKSQFVKVDDESAAVLMGQHTRHLLTDNEILQVASGQAVSGGVSTTLGGLFTQPRVNAPVDHLYGVDALSCPAGTTQVDEQGNTINRAEICGEWMGGFPNELCKDVEKGWYDVQFNGRCMDFCFYYSPTASCGDGYWTCAQGGTDKDKILEPLPDPPLAHDSKLFCEPGRNCTFPRCEHGEADLSTGVTTAPVETM